MVSTRQSRIWGINKICSICYKSFLARNPRIKRCDECRKEDYFDDNKELDDVLAMLESLPATKHEIDAADNSLYKEAEDKLFSKYVSYTRTERLYLDKLSDVIRKELWG